MPAPSPLTTMRLPSAVRRHLDVATAGAQEALIDAHAEEALRLVAIVADDWSFAEALALIGLSARATFDRRRSPVV